MCVNEITYELNIVNNPQKVTRQTKPQKKGEKIEKKKDLCERCGALSTDATAV